MTLFDTISAYVPSCVQEEEDRRLMLEDLASRPDILTRKDETMHFTASAWAVDPSHTKVLMVYHNIYRSWSWTGGHADGEEDLLSVALRELKEETGLQNVRAVSEKPVSLEILTVNAHFKRGKYVAPHLHLNLTYLIEADDRDNVRAKEDENSSVAWFGLDEAVSASSEPDMRVIYSKLNERLKAFPGAV